MKKNCVRITVFLCLLLIILAIINKIFSFKYSDGISQMSEFYKLEEQTVDVLVLGSSHAFVNFSNGTFWDEYGIASYNLGASMQPMWNTYFYLKEALKTQTPKLIVLEAYGATFDFEYSDDSRIIKNTYGMKWSPNKIEAVKVSSKEENYIDFLLDYSQYHTRYSTLKSGDFVDAFGNQDMGYNWYGDDWKGQYLFNKWNHLEIMDVSGVDYVTPLEEKTEKYYRKTIELAKENNIPIIVIVVPYEINEYEQSKYLAAEQIALEYGVEFINCNMELDKIGLDMSRDFVDSSHLTAMGASKFTKYIGDNYVKNYKIASHEGDPKYDTWVRWSEYNRQYELNEQLINNYNRDEIATLLYNPNYWAFISVDGECNSSSDEISDFLRQQGIYDENVNGIWLTQAGTVIYGMSSGTQKQYIMTETHDFCMSYYPELNENELIIDNLRCEKKVGNGINITVYDTKTNIIIDSFGINYDNGCSVVR